MEITTKSTPDYEQLLEYDIRFMLGDLYYLDTETKILDSANTKQQAPILCGFRVGENNFLFGDFYVNHLSITADGRITTKSSYTLPIPAKVRRNIDVIHRDFRHLKLNTLFIFNTQDAQDIDYREYFSTKLSVSVLQYHRKKGRRAAIIPLPGYHTHPSWNVPTIHDRVPFSAKRSRIFWRGALSGMKSNVFHGYGTNTIMTRVDLDENQKISLLKNFPRFYLTFAARDIDILDMGLIPSPIEQPFFDKSIIFQSLTKARATHEQHLQNRYLLALDGFDGPSNFLWAMQSNSVVFRQESEWEIFGDNYFKPWVHYIPVQPDVSDIIEKFEWCEKRIDYCTKITENANASWSILFNDALFEKRIENLYASLAQKENPNDR